MRRDFFPKMIKALRLGSAGFGITVLLAGCVTNPGDTQNLKQRGMDPVIVRSQAESDANRAMDIHTFKIQTVHNTGYIALPELARSIGYHGAWLRDGRTYGIGDTDVVWSFRTGESRVMKAGRGTRMPAPAIRENGRMLIPVSGLKPLFGEEAMLSAGPFGISALPRPTLNETGADGGSFFFADSLSSKPTAKHAHLIAFAKRFLGARYEFGSGSYDSGGTFDSSAYVQHVMSLSGVVLPRSARLQALTGATVSRDELLPGDLLFFNVPGRYKSQSAVGHVGIYLGAGRMIHASPGPMDGVQMTGINDPYHLQSFLYAKRVIRL